MEASESICPDDPIILELVEEEVDAYRNLLPPEGVEELRKALVLAMVSHPYLKDLVEQLKRAPVVQKSGTKSTGEAVVPVEADAAGADAAKSSGRGRRPR